MPTQSSAENEARRAFEANPFPPSPLIEVTDDGIVIATGFSEALHRLLRWVPKAKWRAAERSWIVPFSGAEAVRAVLPEITRLADASRELDEIPAEREPSASPCALLEEAGTALYGRDWQAAIIRDYSATPIADWIKGKPGFDGSDAVFSDLAARLRGKAEALRRIADRLESERRAAAR